MAEVEFTFMTTDSDGQVVIQLPDHPVVWSAEPFGDERRQLSGVDSRIIPLALLKAGKSSAREGSAEAAKDRPTPRRSVALNHDDFDDFFRQARTQGTAVERWAYQQPNLPAPTRPSTP